MKEENKQSNILISRFMGWVFKDKFFDDRYPAFVKYGENGEVVYWFTGGDSWNVSDEWDIPYHSDWNELMPVVEKIEGLDLLNSEYKATILTIGTRTRLKISDGEKALIHIVIDRKTKFESVYDSVISFITWYNQQPK